AAGAAAPGSAQIAAAPRGVWLDPGRVATSQELAYEIRDLAVGDLDGDGRVELIAIDQVHLEIYRWTGRRLELLFQEEEAPRRDYISVDAADLDGDGRAELLVNDAFGDRVRAAIYRQDGRRFVRHDLPRDHYFRILGAEIGAPTLVGQRRGEGEQPFVGQVYRYEWRRGKARRGEALWVPLRAAIFDVQLYRAADGKVELAAFGPTGRLRLFRGREEVWSSGAEFDGTKLRVRERGAQAERMVTEEDQPETPIPGRILPLPGLAGPGGEPLLAFVVRRNERAGLLTRWSFRRGAVLAVAADTPAGRELWRTEAFEGYVAAFRVADLGPVADGVGGRALVVAVDLQRGLFKAARSVVVVQGLR
ncbi:MAG TPA: VCBS repeat-containing protein, partial [Thermodesulfobacteriota bacterium]|nr:VCBS repeat-containing protein [Thermodesulfobacteriota bacterium]